MADGPDKESKTEEPSERQKKNFRDEGTVAISKEIISMAVLLTSAATFYLSINVTGPALLEACSNVLSKLDEFALGADSSAIHQLFKAVIMLVFPVGLTAVIATVCSGFAQTKGLFNLKTLKPKFSKFNPLPQLKKMLFSKQAFIGLLTATGKVAVIVMFTLDLFLEEMNSLVSLCDFAPIEIFTRLGSAVGQLGIRIGAFLIIFAILDYIMIHRRIHKQMMMTRQELIDEGKNYEGNPEIRKRQRQRGAELSKGGRLAAEVPKADVVLVNPTHFAVALRYDQTMQAPKLVAKGSDETALRIREIARRHSVPVLHNPPLTRKIYRQVDAGREVTPQLYQAVAEVLALVYRIKGRIS